MEKKNLNGTVVKGRGPRNGRTRYMIVGEAPGETEAGTGIPFTGTTGEELNRYLENGGLSRGSFYLTNLVKEYREGNPSPTPELVRKWAPELDKEISKIVPTIVLSVGQHATKYFLGNDATMDMMHGIPCKSDKAPGAIVIPCYHPAFGFYDEEARMYIDYDFKRAGEIIRNKKDAIPRVDEFEGKERYVDVTGKQIRDILRSYPPDSPIAIDTEGHLDGSWNWSIQICLEAGTGYILRVEQPDFGIGIAAIRDYCLSNHRPVVIFHNLMHDFSVCRDLGADLFEANVYDTRYAAYVLRVEPQGLKALAFRWCGMKMKSYNETVGDAGIEKQLAYLLTVAEDDWPKPETRTEDANDGTVYNYTPQPVEKRANSIINDYVSGKKDKNGDPMDIASRWSKVDYQLRKMVERKHGPLPVGTLADIPLEDALFYAGRDPDATLRLYQRIHPVIVSRGKEKLVAQGCDVLPVFEEMQDTGMLLSREYCERKQREMNEKLLKLVNRISGKFCGGKPFNPGSPKQVVALIEERKLQPAVVDRKTGKKSTSKKSIEHLRYEDAAMGMVIDWREHAKMRDSFYRPFLEIIGDREEARITTTINPYKVVSRRVSSSNPNLTAVPVRNELGVEVRAGFHAMKGCVYGGWDLSQVEMRYMAHESQDSLLLNFFRTPGLDVHSETAIRIFGLRAPEIGPGVTPEMRYAVVDEMKHRYPSKRAGFGIITNITGRGLLDQLRMAGCKGWTVPKCDKLIDDWLRVYRGVRHYMSQAVQEARKNDMVMDRWGMERPLPGIHSRIKEVKKEAERAASSMKIQGGAQGMLQNAMCWLKPRIRDLRDSGFYVRWIIQIHDEIIFEFEEELTEYMNELVTEALTKHHGVGDMRVPIKCSGHWGPNWGDLK